MSSYQAKRKKEGAPTCIVCGLHLTVPQERNKVRVCDFCRQSGYDEDGVFPARWPGELAQPDAVVAEQSGFHQQSPADRMDSDTFEVELERKEGSEARRSPPSPKITKWKERIARRRQQ